MRSTLLRSAAFALLAAPLLAGCAADDETVIAPELEPAHALFARYVALGNSITAGFQSNGINATTQAQAYPLLVAQAARAPFYAPFFQRDPRGGPGGCPPPLAQPFSPATVDTVTNGCSLRVADNAPYVSNLAVPGATIASGTGAAAANALTTFILGGRTQAQAMVAAQPTLVTVWLGNNDALGAALSGDPARLTSTTEFQASLDALVAQINSTPAAPNDAVVLIGVVNPTVVPALMPAVFPFLVRQNPATAPLLPKPVSNTCAPAPQNPNLANFVSISVLSSTSDSIYCSPDRPFVLTPAEMAAIAQRVGEFNAAIQARASSNGWAYVDPNALLTPFLADANSIRKCQALPAALATGNQAAIAQAAATTCPSPDPAAGFGSLFSYDGVHPSARAHVLLANAVIKALNGKFTGLGVDTLRVQ